MLEHAPSESYASEDIFFFTFPIKAEKYNKAYILRQKETIIHTTILHQFVFPLLDQTLKDMINSCGGLGRIRQEY